MDNPSEIKMPGLDEAVIDLEKEAKEMGVSQEEIEQKRPGIKKSLQDEFEGDLEEVRDLLEGEAT